MRQLFLIVCIILTASSCVKKQNPYYLELNGTGQGIFRGAEIKDDVEKIKKNENSDYLEIDETTFLRYDYPFKNGSGEEDHYRIEYYFDGQNQLHEIVIDAFFKNKLMAKEVFGELIATFTKSYGEFEKSADGYLIWKSATKNTNALEIATIDESDNNEALGYISLQINDYDY